MLLFDGFWHINVMAGQQTFSHHVKFSDYYFNTISINLMSNPFTSFILSLNAKKCMHF